MTPLFEAIERLTNPYTLQERVYRNRVDAQEHLDDLIVARTDDARRMATLEAQHGVTWFPLDKDDAC
jgi:type IV secretory pathway VirD2 relaxase